MRRRGAGFLGVLFTGALVGCASTPQASAPTSPLAPHTTAIRVGEGLALGLRLERLAVTLDGRKLFLSSEQSRASGELARVALEPGVHTVAVLAEASQACGLLEQPRARVVVRARNNFRVGDESATITIDMIPGGVTSGVDRLFAVRFRGERVLLDVPEEPQPSTYFHSECAGGEPTRASLCDVEAMVHDAKLERDLVALNCFADKLAAMQELRSVEQEAFSTVEGDGATQIEAMHAQLRARYAEGRITKLADEARQCAGEGIVTDGAPYTLASACPADDSVATLDELE